MRIPAGVGPAVSSVLGEALGENVSISDFTPASGGCINNGGTIRTTEGSFFVKWNSATVYPGMFAAEAKGLGLLGNPAGLKIPAVSAVGQAEGNQFIIMEHIESRMRKPDFWEDLGTGLAVLHGNTQPAFGLDHDNYIGSLPQHNKTHPSWTEFFIEERLQPMLHLLRDRGDVDSSLMAMTERLFAKLDGFFPQEAPALIHGDLWSGNLMVGSSGEPCLIDPAVYYGHREAELSFTRLFGGFQRNFYDAYNAAFPLESDFNERVDVYNLYPLLVHANLFGGGYLEQAESIVKSLV